MYKDVVFLHKIFNADAKPSALGHASKLPGIEIHTARENEEWGGYVDVIVVCLDGLGHPSAVVDRPLGMDSDFAAVDVLMPVHERHPAHASIDVQNIQRL